MHTRWSVRLADRLARGVITVGGASTIVAVVSVFVFLIWVVVPLFLPAQADPLPAWGQQGAATSRLIQMDDFRALGWTLDDDGILRVQRTRDGRVLQALPLMQSASGGPRTWSAADLAPDRTNLAVAYDGGEVLLCRARFRSRFLPFEEVPPELRGLADGDEAQLGDGVLQATVAGQYRLQTFALRDDGTLRFPGMEQIVDVARAADGSRHAVAVLGTDAGGRPAAQIALGALEESLFTGEQTLTWTRPQPLPALPFDGMPQHILVTDRTDNVTLIWADGRAARFSLRTRADLTDPIPLAETLDLTPGDVRVTATGMLLGGNTIIVGQSDGSVVGWFLRLLQPGELTVDAVDDTALVAGHRMAVRSSDAEITAIANSSRQRLFAVGLADGSIDTFFMTSERHLGRLTTRGDQPVTAVAFAPKDDGLCAATGAALHRWDFEPGHPEVSLQTAFGTVFYERGVRPELKWQSAGGSDAAEPKLSLVPLVFGTLKATLFSMLFAVPLALLAAIYTSEFMAARLRSRVKPVIELMASLPSVVLGFLGGLVIAPFVEEVLGTVVTALALVPFTILVSAHGWQILPNKIRRRFAGYRLWGTGLAMAVGLLLSAALSGTVNRWLFGGSVQSWLNDTAGDNGYAATGWFLLLLPFAAVLSSRILSRHSNPWLGVRTRGRSEARVATWHLGRFAVGALLALLLAGLLCRGLGAVVDLRAPEAFSVSGGISLSPFSAYDQRNALVVGFLMGFAVIPVIYTIAEDALSSVPDHLRAASLGAGASPWQTATRIVVPTAASGLFSAVMIGLGRAVGETMIVLMAAGNTPVLDMNIFSGFRTLSANIATEMPEAVPGSTHYRLLFMTALALFLMTFLINTLAEAVRLRFRRRAVQL